MNEVNLMKFCGDWFYHSEDEEKQVLKSVKPKNGYNITINVSKDEERIKKAEHRLIEYMKRDFF